MTARTRAIVPVHYAGVACEMDTITALARERGVQVVEDAAQGVMARYKGRALGNLGDLGAYSFHETKNLISGEGGALLINDAELGLKAEIMREKGTDRARFFRGEVDKYTWQEVGSSFLPGESTAAFLWAQLEQAESITEKRLQVWNRYHHLLEPLEKQGILRRPIIPESCRHNGHMYYVLLSAGLDRQRVLAEFKKKGIGAVFHYVPLHSSPAGRRFGRTHGSMDVTQRCSEQVIRLPFWIGLTPGQQAEVTAVLENAPQVAGWRKGTT